MLTLFMFLPLASPLELTTQTLDYPGTAKRNPCAWYHGGSLYVFGGTQSTNPRDFRVESFSDDAYKIDLKTGKATALKKAPLPLMRVNALVVGSGAEARGYAVGGITHDGKQWQLADTIWKYDFARDHWEKLPVRLPVGRTLFGLVEYEGALWIFGGWQADPTRAEAAKGPGLRVADNVLKVDLRATPPTVKEVAKLPNERRSFGCARIGHQVYLSGGLDDGFDYVQASDVFDLKMQKWSTFPSPNKVRAMAEMGALGSHLLLAGGYHFGEPNGDQPGSPFTESAELLRFDRATGKWYCERPELPGKGGGSAVTLLAAPDELLIWTLPQKKGDLARLTRLRLAKATDADASKKAAALWPQWRGPQRDGVAPGEPWPDKLDDKHLVPLWRVELAPGYSGPVVDERAVYFAESLLKDKQESVRAVDRQTGKQLWQQKWPGSVSVTFIAKANGDWIKATPALEGDSLFVAGMRDTLTHLDAKTGKIRWQVDFLKEFKTEVPAFGNVSSPLVVGSAVYVQSAGSVLKVERDSGKVVWRALSGSGDMKSNPFSSPVLAKIAGVEQLVVQTRTELAGLDLQEGKPLWRVPVPAFQNTNVLTPTVLGNRVFTASYGGGAFLFEVSRSEDQWTVQPVWRSKLEGYLSSPVVVGEQLYLHLRNQRFAALNLKDGEPAWISEKPFGKYWSLVRRGDRLLALDQRGDLLLIRANPAKLEILDQRHLTDDTSWAHLAVAGDDVIVRDLKGATAYRWSRPRAPR